MVDQRFIQRTVDDCARYWRETGLPGGVIREMSNQLGEHLREATAAGKPVQKVVGPSLADFAESWAAEHRGRRPVRKWDEVRTGTTSLRRRNSRELILYGLGIVALVVAVGISRGDPAVDNEIWRWLWTGLALAMAIGEIFTAGFFLLPFSLGAAAAAVLAWTGVGLTVQWLVFFGVSLIAFVYLRRFIDRQDQMVAPSVGANRWANSKGLVLEAIDPISASGLVRIGGEEWRATADQPIPAGTQVLVLEVTGSKLVVTPIEV